MGKGVLNARQESLDWKPQGWKGWGQTPELGPGFSQIPEMVLQVPGKLLEARSGVQV